MASWLPYANGFEGVVDERKGRKYILWRGYVDGEDQVKRLRVNDHTREEIIGQLENEE